MYRTTHRTRHARHNYDLYGDLENIKDALSEATRHARGKASDVIAQSFDDLKQKTKAAQGTISDVVADKPIKSLGFAMLAGMLIGFFLHR